MKCNSCIMKTLNTGFGMIMHLFLVQLWHWPSLEPFIEAILMRDHNVGSSLRRIDVNKTSFQRCLPAG